MGNARHDKHIESLQVSAGQGADANVAFRYVSAAMLEQKSDLLDLLSKTDTTDIEALQEAHRKYRAVVKLEDYLVKYIRAGAESTGKLEKKAAKLEDRK